MNDIFLKVLKQTRVVLIVSLYFEAIKIAWITHLTKYGQKVGGYGGCYQ